MQNPVVNLCFLSNQTFGSWAVEWPELWAADTHIYCYQRASSFKSSKYASVCLQFCRCLSFFAKLPAAAHAYGAPPVPALACVCSADRLNVISGYDSSVSEQGVSQHSPASPNVSWHPLRTMQAGPHPGKHMPTPLPSRHSWTVWGKGPTLMQTDSCSAKSANALSPDITPCEQTTSLGYLYRSGPSVP